MKRFTLILLSACSGVTFTGPEGGLEEMKRDADSSSDADSGVDPVDSGGLDASDSSSDSSTPDTGPCTNETTGCSQTWDAFCSRLKTCCAGQCAYSWANNGGSECVSHYLGGTSFCAQYRSNDKRCDEQCVSDIQVANCSFMTNNASISGVPAVSNACKAFWP